MPKHNLMYDAKNLKVTEVRVDEGPTLKRANRKIAADASNYEKNKPLYCCCKHR